MYTARCPFMAHRDISWRRNNSVAFGAKRTSSKQCLQNPIISTRPNHWGIGSVAGILLGVVAPLRLFAVAAFIALGARWCT